MANMNPADNDYRTKPGEIKIGASRGAGTRDHRVLSHSDGVPMIHQSVGGASSGGPTTSERIRSVASRVGMTQPKFSVKTGGRSGGRGGAANFGSVTGRGR